MILRNYTTYPLCLAAIIAMVSCSYLDKTPSPENLEQEQDIITVWLKQAEDTTAQEKIVLLAQAYRAASKLQNDSLKARHLVELSYQYSKTDDITTFRKINGEAIQLTKKVQDSSSLAGIYWDLGGYFSNANKIDSAFYSYSKAQQIYDQLNNDFSSARMLINMAIKQIEIKDYTGSEINTSNAITLLDPLNKYSQLYNCYNNLGIIFKELGDYDKALQYYNKARDYLKKTSRIKTSEPIILNNIGVIYKNQEKYEEAIAKYEEAQLKNSLYAKDPKREATFIDNIAYAQFKLGDATNLPEMFFEALKIRDSINDLSGIVLNKLHLAEYYTFYKDTVKALQYAREAYEVASSSNNSGDLLASLLELSKLEKSEKSNIYLNNYITLNDSLHKVERNLRDKFARIRFESEELERENKEISERLAFILNISSGVLAFGILVFIIITLQSRNRKLKIERVQQRANEEIYNLMLGQQTKVEEGRQKERKRISEELHDGVLGKLFGTRLMLGNLNSGTDEVAIQKRKEHLKDLQDIEKEIRGVSHTLNNAELLIVKKGFVILVVNLLETHSKISKFTFSKKGDEDINWEAIPGKVKANLYRIIQESVQNINKYAKASVVGIEFKKDNNELSIIIIDNGVGFDMSRKKSGIGIKNIKSRMAALNGKVTIESSKNKGTKINLTVPLNL